MKIINFLVLLLISFLSMSCSRFDLVLKWADFAVAEYADSYFDLNSEQKKQLKQAVNEFISLGRKSEFKNIGQTLNEIALEVEKNTLDQEKINSLNEKINTHFLKFFSELAPYLAKESAGLNKEQWSNYRKKIFEDVEKSKKENSDPEKSDKNRIKRFVNQFEFWFEYLTDAQTKEIEKFVKKNTFHWESHWLNKINLANKISDEKLTSKERQEIILKIVTDFSFLRDQSYVEQQKKYQNSILNLIINMNQTLEDKQKNNLIKNLRKISSSFAESSRLE